MGEARVHHDATGAGRGTEVIVLRRRTLCVECKYNRGTSFTPICTGPLLGSRSIAPCTLGRMLRDPAATCYHDDEAWRARWKSAELDSDDESCDEHYSMARPQPNPPQSPRIIVPRPRTQRGRDVVMMVYQKTGERTSGI